MASNIPGVRLVRCPKCRTLLAENAEVPVYQCGGCGTLLRAKNRAISVEGGISTGSTENNSQNLSGGSSLNRESASAVIPPIPCSSNVDGRIERLACSDLAVSNSISANNPDKMEECSTDACDPKTAEQMARGSSEANAEAKSEPDERIQVEQGHSLDEQARGGSTCEERIQDERRHSPDEQTEESANPSPQDCDSSRSSEKADQSPESIAVDADVSEDMKLAAGSSHSYDGSASSPDRRLDNRLPKKYLLLSRRTFRHKKVVLNSTDSMEKETKVQGQQLQEKSLDERVTSEVRGSSDSKRDISPSRAHILALERDTTFGSEDFHSVQNWMGSETDAGGSKSLPKDLPSPSQFEKPSANVDCLEPDHMKILRKVDELRDELSGFLTRTVEGKGASHFNRRFSHIPISSQPPCSTCLPRPHNTFSQSNLPSYLHKAPAEENAAEKSNGREKKVPPIKSFCRPVTGGAPFVVCYKCWKLLQLPADFLVARKRLHKLRCSACSEVLVFSFRPKVGTAPMTPTEARHPPSEAENHNDRRVLDPMSFSDDYGVSFARSYSSEAEPALHVSRNSSYSIEGSDGRRVRCSRLHRLMGYSSASELLFRPRAGADEGYESTEPDTPQFYRPSEGMRYGLNETGTVAANSAEIQEEEESQERSRTPRRGSALHGLLKKGVRELSQGLESVKLRIHSNG